MDNDHRRFKLLAHAEGISFLVILFITMPLKYMLEMGMPNKVIGMLHGVLFIGYILAIAFMKFKYKWKATKTGLAILSSVVPFGTFVFVRKYLSEQGHEEAGN
jgi:integral membrane protein